MSSLLGLFTLSQTLAHLRHQMLYRYKTTEKIIVLVILDFFFSFFFLAQELKTKSSEKLVVREVFQIVKIFYGQWNWKPAVKQRKYYSIECVYSWSEMHCCVTCSNSAFIQPVGVDACHLSQWTKPRKLAIKVPFETGSNRLCRSDRLQPSNTTRLPVNYHPAPFQL